MDGGLTDINLGNGWSQSGNVYSHEGSGPTLTIVVNMGAGNVTVKDSALLEFQTIVALQFQHLPGYNSREGVVLN